MAGIDRYLKLAVDQKASDIHFSSGQAVRMRLQGDLTPLDERPMSAEQMESLLFEVLTEEERERFHAQHNLDKSYSSPGIGNFRINIFKTRSGIAGVLRIIPSRLPSIAELGLPETVKNLCELGKGLILVTGPTGSGKSTTLAAMIHHINQYFPYHILTAEDPVEFVHTSNMSLINQREIGNSCPTFADALKYALREDPDVILVGEMRDLETIALALTAAETGHLVFGTLHTRGAAASIDRIIDSFPGNQQAMIRTMLAESLVAVISQSLLKRADGVGRVAAYELMIVNHAIANLIREGKTFQVASIIQTARKEGMMLMEQHIKELVQKGVVSKEEAASYLEQGTSMANRKAAGAVPSVTKPTPIKPTFGGPAATPQARPPGVPGRPVAVVPPKPLAPPPPEEPSPFISGDDDLGIPGGLDLSEVALDEGITGAFSTAAAPEGEAEYVLEPESDAEPVAPVARPVAPTPAVKPRPAPAPVAAAPAPAPRAPAPPVGRTSHLPPPPVIPKKKVG